MKSHYSITLFLLLFFTAYSSVIYDNYNMVCSNNLDCRNGFANICNNKKCSYTCSSDSDCNNFLGLN